jgi:hypothetical protein
VATPLKLCARNINRYRILSYIKARLNRCLAPGRSSKRGASQTRRSDLTSGWTILAFRARARSCKCHRPAAILGQKLGHPVDVGLFDIIRMIAPLIRPCLRGRICQAGYFK